MIEVILEIEAFCADEEEIEGAFALKCGDLRIYSQLFEFEVTRFGQPGARIEISKNEDLFVEMDGEITNVRLDKEFSKEQGLILCFFMGIMNAVLADEDINVLLTHIPDCSGIYLVGACM